MNCHATPKPYVLSCRLCEVEKEVVIANPRGVSSFDALRKLNRTVAIFIARHRNHTAPPGKPCCFIKPKEES